MSLVKDETVTLEVLLDRWRHFTPSSVSDHGEECCRTARDWFVTIDASFRHPQLMQAAPEWILRSYPWGTSCWPIHWCELVVADTLDCGALACATLEVWRARGETVYFVQMVQEFSKEDIAHWERQWIEASLDPFWTVGLFSYHEACALVRDIGSITVWDPSVNSWVHPDFRSGYASTRAIRVFTPEGDARGSLNWEGVVLKPNVWNLL